MLDQKATGRLIRMIWKKYCPIQPDKMAYAEDLGYLMKKKYCTRLPSLQQAGLSGLLHRVIWFWLVPILLSKLLS